MPPFLPLELIEEILRHLTDPTVDGPALARCSLVSHDFRALAQKLLFTSISLNSLKWEGIRHLVDVLKISAPELAQYTKALQLGNPREIQEGRGEQVLTEGEQDDLIAELMGLLPNLRKLSFCAKFAKWESLGPGVREAIEALFNGCSTRQVETLELNSLFLLPPTLFLFSTSLKTLIIGNATFDYSSPFSPKSFIEANAEESRVVLRLQHFQYRNPNIRNRLVALDPTIFSELKTLRMRLHLDDSVQPEDTKFLLESCSNTLTTLDVEWSALAVAVMPGGRGYSYFPFDSYGSNSTVSALPNLQGLKNLTTLTLRTLSRCSLRSVPPASHIQAGKYNFALIFDCLKTITPSCPLSTIELVISSILHSQTDHLDVGSGHSVVYPGAEQHWANLDTLLSNQELYPRLKKVIVDMAVNVGPGLASTRGREGGISNKDELRKAVATTNDLLPRLSKQIRVVQYVSIADETRADCEAA
ncbi:hypothetical protein CC1G_10240 [Coprinopsis cinerea okayama7|uniref:F-box domain-containing protein n=1 Tax=Coprinopsis cinerea (strain Okayama-7 / 130 / ATCC MYA-4618 / FGSC 9003) TaxID=240176 RepID=A8NPD5_COPC7|nr:hypothetical protein CC1G_10240 [Coprinopsis cinerea okayama7\|eukprot:XP_001835313.1 hypothetical protein CC1G_10240 [Coprinopsis cinerea okayama7\